MLIDQPEPAATAAEKETGRLEAFSDGVFAVAITLLVFNLLNVPPPPTAAASQLTPQYLLTALARQWPAYVTFCISFATILIMWINHHGMFKLVQRSDTRFMFANGFLLLLTTIVPFPTALVATYLLTPAAWVACAVYSGLFVVINIAYNLLWWTAAQQWRLLKPTVPRAQVQRLTRSYLFGFPAYLVALICALFQLPLISVGICAVLWLFWALTMYERSTPTSASHPLVERSGL